MFRAQALIRRLFWGGAAIVCVLCWVGEAAAQGGGFGGQGGGGLTGGGSGGSFGGGISGGGLSGGGFIGGMNSRNQMPGAMRGFRPLVSSTIGSGFRNTTQFGQLGGGQFGQQLGGVTGGFGGGAGGGVLGRGQQFGVVPTRISGAAVAETIKPAPPPFPEIQTRLEKLLRVSAGEFEGRKLILELEGPALVIRGTVRNDYEKQLTESLARLEPGVTEVKNELTVSFPSRVPAASPPGPAPPGPAPPGNPASGGNRPP